MSKQPPKVIASMPDQQIHFVTGKLAESSLRSILETLGPQVGFQYTVQVMNITVAALMTTDWIAKRIEVPTGTTSVMVTGYCRGEMDVLRQSAKVPVELGPKDLRQLPAWFGESPRGDDYGKYDIEIIAEINHAPSIPMEDLLAEAKQLIEDGADRIDVGCDPGSVWHEVGDCVRQLCEQGIKVSVDSLNPEEIAMATSAGADLVLSVNSTNREHAPNWNCDVVAIPDDPRTMEGLDETIAFLEEHNVPYRIDPILEPIGFGFANSLGRYLSTRDKYPNAEIMMGIGNITELTDADSAGLNVLLLGFCQELGIRSVLTTQVINWASSSVKECDLARRLLHYSVNQQVLPKRLEPNLVTLRDVRVDPIRSEELDKLSSDIKDHNYRIFASDDTLHLVGANLHLSEKDPFLLFEKLIKTSPANVDASHGFYLGFELCKALTALTLSKQYRQDEALDWGYLTLDEPTHRVKLSGTQRPVE
ncbi:MAG: dihydropteroate synthase [Blastopirellula sp.]|nr:MAG: dihydropteroate synthase [Blastopirellula sp.]